MSALQPRQREKLEWFGVRLRCHDANLATSVRRALTREPKTYALNQYYLFCEHFGW